MSRRGSFRWGRVQRVYVEGGVPVADVVDVHGYVWTSTRIMGLGGGIGHFAYIPPSPELDPVVPQPSLGQGAEVALFVPDGNAARPWIFGALHSPFDAAQVIPLVAFTPDSDYEALGVNDYGFKNGGAAFTLSPFAGPVLDAGEGLDIRAQLAAGGSLRISIAGEAAEGLLLSGPTLAYLETLSARVNSLTAALAAVETWGLTQSPPLVPDPLTSATALLLNPLAPPTKILESAAVKISSLSKGV